MTTPRLEVDLAKVGHNARTLVTRLAARGISVTGVTKVALGAPALARCLVEAGVGGLGDSRMANLERIRRARITMPVTLLRSPSPSEVGRVVRGADASCNSELSVVRMLSAAAVGAGRVHGVLAMVELGDLREGMLPGDVPDFVGEVLGLPGCRLVGLGTNLACRSGVVPDEDKMEQLSAIVDETEERFGIHVDVVSGGNSANLDWAASAVDIGRVNDLRVGEAILLGRETLRRQPIDGLHTDAVTVIGEVIESRVKPSAPWGRFAQSAFGEVEIAVDRGPVAQSIVALGRQDVDPDGLTAPAGMTIEAASSDHLVVTSPSTLTVGDEVTFQLDYSALLRAMTSPFVVTRYQQG